MNISNLVNSSSKSSDDTSSEPPLSFLENIVSFRNDIRQLDCPNVATFVRKITDMFFDSPLFEVPEEVEPDEEVELSKSYV